jgi:O-antigen ligase
VSIAAAVLSQSRSTLLGLVAGLVCYYINNWKRLIPILIVLGIIAVSLPIGKRFVSPASYTIRIGHYYYFSEIIKDHPVFGIGYSIDAPHDEKHIDRDKYMARIPEAHRRPVHPYLWPHNVLVNVAVRTGIPGAVAFMAFFLVPAVLCLRLIATSPDGSASLWGRCCLALICMFFVKGNFEPIFTILVETIFMIILATVSSVWMICGASPTRPGAVGEPGTTSTK